jgi:hypothetical protein
MHGVMWGSGRDGPMCARYLGRVETGVTARSEVVWRCTWLSRSDAIRMEPCVDQPASQRAAGSASRLSRLCLVPGRAVVTMPSLRRLAKRAREPTGLKLTLWMNSASVPVTCVGGARGGLGGTHVRDTLLAAAGWLIQVVRVRWRVGAYADAGQYGAEYCATVRLVGVPSTCGLQKYRDIIGSAMTT